jgi:hypothetical protein
VTDREYNEQKRRIQALIKKWVRPLGLGWWQIDFTYNRDGLESKRGDRDCVGSCDADWEYLRAYVSFNLPKLAEMDNDDAERVFVHELCHIFVNEMRMWGDREIESEKHDEAMHHEERVVTQLANAFLWARQAGFDEGIRNVKKSLKRKR